jgi:ketosteroid isomerase-like protein
MKMLKVCGLLATMLLVFVASQAQQPSSLESDKVRVLALENSWNEAEKNKDGKALDHLLASSFSYTDSDGSFMNKAQFLASITAPSYHPGQIINETMKAEAYGHVVVVSGTYREEGSEKGKSYVHRGRFTDTWVQERGAWLCAASQETLITH